MEERDEPVRQPKLVEHLADCGTPQLKVLKAALKQSNRTW